MVVFKHLMVERTRKGLHVNACIPPDVPKSPEPHRRPAIGFFVAPGSNWWIMVDSCPKPKTLNRGSQSKRQYLLRQSCIHEQYLPWGSCSPMG